jgi:hypothetical protein
MKARVRFAGVLFSLCAFLGGALPGHSAVLVGTQGSSLFSLTNDFGVFSTFQPVADVHVMGNSDVSIGGFGVFGAAEEAGKIRFVIFRNDALLWQSGPYDVAPGSARWYDTSYSSTLVSGDTYTMGVVSNNMFAWGQNTQSDEGFGPIGGNGLEIMPHKAFAQLDLEQGADFVGDPYLLRGFEDYGYQTSLRIFDAGGAVAPPIPEPAEWSMLLAGLLVMTFVANRRRGISA